jgi:lipopolysaccharide export system permease protein
VTKGGEAGFWARDGQRFIEVEQAPSRYRLEGIRVYRLDAEGGVDWVLEAPEADYREGRWYLGRSEITRFTEDGVAVEQREPGVWDTGLRPEVLDVVVVEPDRLPIFDLATYIDYLERNSLESDRYRLAFWIKIATPVAVVTMLVLTVPLVFGSLRSAGAGRQLFLGIFIGLAFYVTNRWRNYAGVVYGLPVMLGALGEPILVLAAGIWGIRRVR